MKALLLVDIQNDFLPGGALAVPRGDEVVAVANRLAERFDLVVATQDWHPSDHRSFSANHPGKKVGERIMLDGLEQILWPVHCVQDTRGAEFPAALNTAAVSKVVRKGTDRNIDSYSGFFDNGRRRQTELDGFLRGQGVTKLYIAGLATDYCVKFTALDAARMKFKTFVVKDGCRGVEMNEGDVQAALQEMQAARITLVPSQEVVQGR